MVLNNLKIKTKEKKKKEEEMFSFLVWKQSFYRLGIFFFFFFAFLSH